MKPQAGQVGRIVPWSSADTRRVAHNGQKRAGRRGGGMGRTLAESGTDPAPREAARARRDVTAGLAVAALLLDLAAKLAQVLAQALHLLLEALALLVGHRTLPVVAIEVPDVVVVAVEPPDVMVAVAVGMDAELVVLDLVAVLEAEALLVEPPHPRVAVTRAELEAFGPAELGREGAARAVPQDLDRHGARLAGAQGAAQLVAVGHVLVADLEDHVAGLEPGPFGRSVVQDLEDECSLVVGRLEVGAEVVAEVVGLDAEAAAAHGEGPHSGHRRDPRRRGHPRSGSARRPRGPALPGLVGVGDGGLAERALVAVSEHGDGDLGAGLER